MKIRALSVSELNQYVKRILSSDPILSNIHLRGEVSNFKVHNSGHAYFSLKDEKSKVNCIMFRENFSKLKYTITEGLNVIVKGYISVYERDGQYQMYIREMEPDGIGSLYLAFQQLKRRLEQEGLFDISHKKKISRFPKKIAVITSPTGAAIRDIISVIQRRNPTVDILIYPVLVQGETASGEISQAIHRLNCLKNIDIIILGRGGGSIEELWAFNEEIVARSIFASRIPIISAVGHETDFTISDFVADLRAPTPSAAAEMAVPYYGELKNTLEGYRNYLNLTLLHQIKEKKNYLQNFGKDRMDNLLDSRLREEQQHLDALCRDLQNNVENIFEKKKNRLMASGYKLEVLNPLSTLFRGYAIAYDGKNKNNLCSVDQVKLGDDIHIMLTDGKLLCTVADIHKGEEGIENFRKQMQGKRCIL
ncbi:Exodeoxyribonuclease 7 large subunit [Thermotalea metallivorans]|uniref:Exodeoxyribonuclease 7 large subunit n=2 Tax=Thermotalea metallivorans TaxID=520762 RepID=A0A140L8D0_9FIRM|nr:Exodeoxyribonuclease 7 large subunit [Thermotalea metallivorans]